MQPSSSFPPFLLAYKAVQNQINVGDVIAFSSTDIPSGVVKLATQSAYVHVAIVLSTTPTDVVDSMDGGDRPDHILIAESHVDTSLPSVGTGEPVLGVQVQWLANRLVAQKGKAWWAALHMPLSVDRQMAMQKWLQTIEKQRIPYDFLQAITAGLDGIFEQDILTSPANYSALFCSELVTRALQLAGVVPESINPSEQTPADVMRLPCLQEPVLIKDDET